MKDQDESKAAPKVFVSYAHETPEHKNWVKSLATDLRSAAIDALLDDWRVDLGDDFTLFMDKIRICERVLLICTPTYARKSNEGEGGVGYERSVITAELAKKIATAKFVCVLRSGDPEESVPTFARSRRFIDFRDDSEYEIRLKELLRSLHNVPADTEPPLGRNPFAGESNREEPARTELYVPRGHNNEFDPGTVANKAQILLSRKDMLGWKRLLRRVRRHIGPRLLAWREGLSEDIQTEENWLAAFDEGVKISEPLFLLALTAIDSEIETIRDQTALIDDLLNIEGWKGSGLRTVVSMPKALAFLYHHIVGAFLVEANQHKDALRLLTRQVRDNHTTKTGPIWHDYALMGWVDSLDHNCITSWKYLRSFCGSRDWMRAFFHSERSFFDAYRAYIVIASTVELATFLGKGATPEQVSRNLRLDVPPMFVHPGDDKGTDINDIVRRAIPTTTVLADIAGAGGCDATGIRQAWPAWFQQWVKFLSQDFRILAGRLGRGHPPPLPD